MKKLRKGDTLTVVQRWYGQNVRFIFTVHSNGPEKLELLREGWEQSRRLRHSTWDHHLYREFAPLPNSPVIDYKDLPGAT